MALDLEQSGLMRTLLRKHWVAIVGLASLLKGVLNMVGNADLIITRIQDPSWIGTVVNWIIYLPRWATLLLVVVGFLLIWWDLKRRRPEAVANPIAAPMHSGIVAPPRIPPRGEKLILLGKYIMIATALACVGGLVIGMTLIVVGEYREKISANIATLQPRKYVAAHVTPEFLVSLREGERSIYLEWWIPVSGPMGSIDARSVGDSSTVLFSDLKRPYIYMYFNNKWIDDLAKIPKNQIISVYGQIREIDNASITLRNCEIIDPSTKSNVSQPTPSVPSDLQDQ